MVNNVYSCRLFESSTCLELRKKIALILKPQFSCSWTWVSNCWHRFSAVPILSTHKRIEFQLHVKFLSVIRMLCINVKKNSTCFILIEIYEKYFTTIPRPNVKWITSNIISDICWLLGKFGESKILPQKIALRKWPPALGAKHQGWGT